MTQHTPKRKAPYSKATWDRETAVDDKARREYFRAGVEEFRTLLEREFRRTHPSGRLNFDALNPSSHDFRVSACPDPNGPLAKRVASTASQTNSATAAGPLSSAREAFRGR